MSKPPPETDNSRLRAARTLGKWLDTGVYPEDLLANEMRDRAFLTEVLYGTVRRRRSLDWVIDCYARNRPDKSLVPYLMVGLYQVLFMDNVADHAAVHETVQAARQGLKLSDRAAGFVNGVLRRAVRERDSLHARLEAQPPGIRYSHPDELVERWTAQFGETRTSALCEWNNRPARTVLRVNGLVTDKAALTAALRDAGIGAQEHPFAPDTCLVLERGARVGNLPGYTQGLFSVQDPSTLACVGLLDPCPGEQVLDACAAPGGKTGVIAERMRGEGRIVAVDSSKARLRRLRENVKRLRLASVEIVRADATVAGELAGLGRDGLFDRILLDVPCTNTGVLRRRPDARWRFSLEKLSELTAQQKAMLDNAAGALKPDGVMVYSTCSLEPEEGDTLVTGWLGQQPGFEEVQRVRLFPPESGTDGVFALSLRRKMD